MFTVLAKSPLLELMNVLTFASFSELEAGTKHQRPTYLGWKPGYLVFIRCIKALRVVSLYNRHNSILCRSQSSEGIIFALFVAGFFHLKGLSDISKGVMNG